MELGISSAIVKTGSVRVSRGLPLMAVAVQQDNPSISLVFLQ